MKKTSKAFISLFLVVALILSFTACSKTQMTEENIVYTVGKVETALKEFDTKDLEKYVSSVTLNYILSYAKDHEQFVTLGKAIFKDVTIQVDSVDVENHTVTVTVKNKDLGRAAADFATDLKSRFSPMQLLGQLNNDSFLNVSLAELVNAIDSSTDYKEVTVTINVKQGKKNLVLSFDDDSEDAVSGGALNSIKGIYK